AQDSAKLAIGTKEGLYGRLADGMRERLGGQGVELTIEETSDCLTSLERLHKGDVRFALAPQDVVSEYFRGNRDTKVRVVDRVFFDYLHIFLRESLHINTLSDLARLRVWAGEEKSGTHLAAARFFDSLGIPLATLGDRHLVWDAPPDAWDNLPNWFRNDRLDVAILAASPGTPSICRLMASGTCSLLPLDANTLRRLGYEARTDGQDRYRRQISVGEIPKGTYANQRGSIATIAIPVLLLAHADERTALAARLRDAAQEEWREAVERPGPNGCRIPENLPEAEPLRESGLRLLRVPHPPEPPLARLSRAVTPILPFLLFLAAGTLLFLQRRRCRLLVRYLWNHYRVLCVIGLVLGGSVLIITLSAFHVEHQINENFSSVWESFWSITIYLFSGLEDRVPYTTAGRILVTLGLLVGAVCSTVASGWTASLFIRREKRMPQNLRNHFLMLNWNERAAAIVRQLHHPILRRQDGVSVIVILTDDESLTVQKLKEAGSGRDPAFEDFFLSIGDPTEELALLNANAQDARTIVVLADEKHGDERALRSVFMLRRIAKQKDVKLHVVVELLEAANDCMVEELAKDFPGSLELVSGLQIRTLLLAQAALNTGIVGFYTDLLRISGDSNEVYTQEIPETAVGMRFREYASLVVGASSATPLIPVGVQRQVNGKPQILTNPQPKTPGDILQPGDRLLLIAYGPPERNALPVPERSRAARRARPSLSPPETPEPASAGSLP
ncbi:MAG TPA: TAXI family TRAP transporter solute-binding subunit, partial [Thermoanaerobaculia bacterium]|nr:TAXI family TRAP transporter solute-binding subunit [Thermoanaerobaculia bacterium]